MAGFPGSFEGLGMPPGISPAPGLGPDVQPPGLWQAPGLVGTGGTSSSRGMPGVSPDEINGFIEGQVMRLIQTARQGTEAKVKTELKQIVEIMMAMDARFDQLIAALENTEPARAPESALDPAQVSALVAKIDQQWDHEMRMLKQELHQTILAHNHNADLIKHHKDTIDAMQETCAKRKNNNAKSSDIHQQITRMDARLKQQQKHKKLDSIYARIAALEEKVAAAAQQYHSYSGVMPAMPPGALSAPPGIEPPSIGLVGRGTSAVQDVAAYRCPTDEEVRERLGKLAQPRAADTGKTEGAEPDED